MRDERFPAATCIGRRDGDPMVQVYWLAGRAPGLPLENPRQVSAYRYPREYGPTPPSFSRAMLASDRLVMISGTASIVGHASRHRGNVRAQLDETFTNLANVLQRAAGRRARHHDEARAAVAAEDLPARRSAAARSARRSFASACRRRRSTSCSTRMYAGPSCWWRSIACTVRRRTHFRNFALASRKGMAGRIENIRPPLLMAIA